jgi:hypothetical protein
VTAEELAARTGLHPRWLLEWLRCQAAGLIDFTDGHTFELGREAAALLADEDASVWFAAGAFQGAAAPADTVDRLAESFRTGGGLSFDDFGPDAARKVERTLGPWSRLALVPAILPALHGVTQRLETGARIADVGCGSGITVLTLAEASRTPASTATTRPSPRSNAHATASPNENWPNAAFHHQAAEQLPGKPTYG